MGHTYASLKESAVYSKTEQKKLGIGDTLWVIEGDTNSPMVCSLVDCFSVGKPERGPFYGDYAGFKLRLSGASQLGQPVLLDGKRHPWFKVLHAKYLTKQRFFERIAEEEIAIGLRSTANSQR
jgi:hypothetical protein